MTHCLGDGKYKDNFDVFKTRFRGIFKGLRRTREANLKTGGIIIFPLELEMAFQQSLIEIKLN